jgi:hypothetical protein
VIQFNAKIGSGAVLIEFLSNCQLNLAVKLHPDNCLLLMTFARGDYEVTSPVKVATFWKKFKFLNETCEGTL